MSGQSAVGNSIQVKKRRQAWGANIEDYVNAIAWSPVAPYRVLVGAANGEAMVLDGESGKILRRWAAHPMGTLCVGWSFDGRWFATGGQDGKARIYDGQSLAEVAELPCGGAAGQERGGPWVEHLAWSPHSNVLATVAGKHLIAWSPEGDIIQRFEPHENTIAGMAWHPGMKDQLATSSYNGIRRFKLDAPTAIRRFQWKGSLLMLAWSPDGKHLATGTQDAAVHVWDAQSGEDLQMTGYPVKLNVLCWDRTSTLLATGGSEEITVWDFKGKGPAGSRPIQLSAHVELIMALGFQHAGDWLASGCQKGRIFFWHPRMIEQPLEIAVHSAPISCLAWSPDDAMLAAADADGQICCWLSVG